MSDSKDVLRRVKESLDKTIGEKRDARKQSEDDRRNFILSMGQDLLGVLHPLLEKIAEGSKFNKEELKEIISQIKVEAPEINFPEREITIPPITVPEPKVTVNVPPFKFPEFKFPEQKPFPSTFKINDEKPLPVVLTDSEGKRYSISQFASGG